MASLCPVYCAVVASFSAFLACMLAIALAFLLMSSMLFLR